MVFACNAAAWVVNEVSLVCVIAGVGVAEGKGEGCDVYHWALGSTIKFFLAARSSGSAAIGLATTFGKSSVCSDGCETRFFFDFFAGCLSILSEISCSVFVSLRLLRNVETSFDKAG